MKTVRSGGQLSLVAIMRKVRRGTATSSWRFVEYANGRTGPGFSKVGGGQQLCRSCHVSATQVQGSDAVFYRLGAAPTG